MRWRMGGLLVLFSGAGSSLVPGLWAQTPSRPQLAAEALYSNPEAQDQDDLCLFADRETPERGLVITSDKSAGRVFLYEPDGRLQQSIELQQPGNIDLRTDVPWNGNRETLVVVNERAAQRLAVFRIDRQRRELERLDDGSIVTGENYGGCLLRTRDPERLVAVVTSKTQGVSRWELSPTAEGRATGRRVGAWPLGFCEGAVGDDATGDVYVAVEDQGVYRLPGNTEQGEGAAEPALVIRVGEAGLRGDVEGMAILAKPQGGRYLVLSDQGNSEFRIHELRTPYALVAAFTLEGVAHTDGLDVQLASLGPRFPLGLFACHSDVDSGKSVRAADARLLLELLP